MVATPDGVDLSVQEWGNPDGLPVLFIHGLGQAHLSWAKQYQDPALSAALRMVTFDLRGHGLSGKPEAREAYQESPRWANDVRAVMLATSLERPVLVGWSYAGRVMCDYLLSHGSMGISGVNFVGATTNAPLNAQAHASPFAGQMVASDLATQIAGTRAFLRACFSRAPTQEEFEAMVAFNAMTPAAVRRDMLGRPTPYEDMLKGLRLPVLVTHGREDQAVVAAMGEYTARTVPGAQLSMYEGVGHCPFWEEPARFNAELLAFVRRARG
jgi:pimeloyl-ACP methyl ester carboxylesterase